MINHRKQFFKQRLQQNRQYTLSSRGTGKKEYLYKKQLQFAREEKFELAKIRRDVQSYNQKNRERIKKIPQEELPRYHNPFVKYMVEIAKRVKQKLRQDKIKELKEKPQSEFLQRNYLKRPLTERLYTNFDINAQQSRHIFHPPSKLLLPGQEQPITMEAKEKKIQKQKNIVRSFKLTYNSSPLVKSPYFFAEYISGGPKKPRETLYQFRSDIQDFGYTKTQFHSWISPSIEHEAANKIKRTIRAYIIKKRYYEAIETLKWNKTKNIQKKIKELVEKKKENIFEKQKQKIEQQAKKMLEKKRLLTSQQSDSVIDARSNKKTQKDKIYYYYEDLSFKHKLLFESIAKNDISLITRSGFKYNYQDLNIKDEKHNTPLYYATKYGFQGCCEFLLLKGADPNLKCEHGNTSLHQAFIKQKTAIILGLLNEGASVLIKNCENLTPLAYSNFNQLKKLDLLDKLKNSADIKYMKKIMKTAPNKFKYLQ